MASESLLEVCPKGAWVSEDHAVQTLGFSSRGALKDALQSGSLPHVYVEHGKRYNDVPHPYNKHRFYFIQKVGTTATRPSVNLATWVNMCLSLEEGSASLSPPTQARVREYTNNKSSNVENSYRDLKSVRGVVFSNELSGIAEGDDDGYRYGSNGGTVLMASKAAATASSSSSAASVGGGGGGGDDDGEVYTRADGKKVRRVKRASSVGAPPESNGTKSLSGFLSQAPDNKTESKLSKLSGSRSVSGEGEVYLRADGKKVRRVKKSRESSVSDEVPSNKSLAGFLENSPSSNGRRLEGSASVAGDQLAISKESSLTGEVYLRADGKKVRRVTKSTANGAAGTNGSSVSLAGDENVEIITRPDGTRFRRIKKPKPATSTAESTTAITSPAATTDSTSTNGGGTGGGGSGGGGLSAFLGNPTTNNLGSQKKFSGSHSVAGDQHLEGEIYYRADGKKVRRVRKAKATSGGSGASLSGFLDAEAADKPKQSSGAATVAGGGGTMESSDAEAQKPETEIYVRPDGTKVRRIRKTAAKPIGGENGEKKSLGGFLSMNEPTGARKFGGSASVAGDQIAVSKESSLTGEVYVRADGKKVRRIMKPASATTAAEASGDNVEIITRPDGTKVRRIRKTKAAPAADDSNQLSGFLESQPRSATMGSAATVGGDRIAPLEDKKIESEENTSRAANVASQSVEPAKKSLDGFLGNMDSKPKRTGSASVAGDQIAVSKDASLTGEVYVRADGKMVRRVRKPTQAQPGDQVEIITRPDGTKVRRIRRAKQPEETNSTIENGSSLGAMLGSAEPRRLGSSATVSGDMAEGEIYIRADGKKVRRVRKPSASCAVSDATDDNYEIITREDGKKVRRIKRSALAAQQDADVHPRDSKTLSLSSMLSRDEALSARVGGAATVAGDYATGKSSLNSHLTDVPDKRIATPLSAEDEEIASRYRKMLRMGMPEGAVVQKMAADDISQSVQDSVVAGTEQEPEAPPPSMNHLEKMKCLSLSVEDEESATHYRKMLKMGMPEGAVQQKMSTDGVPQYIQDSVLGGDEPSGETAVSAPVTARPLLGVVEGRSATKTSSLSSDEEAIAVSYRKMLKMGMPDGAVIQKMSVDGIAQNIQDSVIAGEVPASPKSNGSDPSSKMSSMSAQEEDIASTYRKMLKMGMPNGAVIQKMSVDGVPQSIQDSVIAGNVSVDHSEPPLTSQKFSSLSPSEEAIASQYRKMLKMGMPEGAVMQKMTVDDVARNIQNSVIAGEIPPPKASVPEGMALVQKDAATVPDGMVLVPKEQADRTMREGMVAVPKEVAGEGVPEGYVLVPKDQVKGDPGDDLILVRKDQVKNDKSTYIVLMGPDESMNKGNEDRSNVDISGANIVSMDDLPGQVERLKKSDGRGQPRFLLQALPDDKDLEDEFIRKNLLPKQEHTSRSASAPAAPPAPAKPSTSVAEILAQMSSMGGDFDAEKMGELLAKLEFAEKRQAKLEKQLAAAGVAIAEDIDYDICVKKVEEIGKRMNEIGGSDVTHPDKEEQNRLREEYFKLEQEMEKYNNALLLTDEYVAEQDRLEKKWEADNLPGNLEALKQLRRHMPVEVRNMSEAQLTTEPTPNGMYLPTIIAKKFKRTNVLQVIRRAPDDIVRMHPSTLDNMRVTGLTLTERRALYEHLRGVGPQWYAMKAEKMTERKWTWYNMMKSNFKENLASWQRHVDQYGPPGAHPYATRANPNEGCPLIGKQCPLKADKLIDYDGDYGFSSDDEYEVSEVRKADTDDPGAKAMQEALELMKEKKANERSEALKKHYAGKLLQVSKANGSCEQMDEMMDKMEYAMLKILEDIFIRGDDKSKLTEDVKKKEVASMTDVLNDCKLSTLDFCGRAGIQLSGKKTDDEKADPRSILECSLSGEVAEAFDVFAKFINYRLKQTEVADTRIKSTIDTLNTYFKELQERNEMTLKALGGARLERSRKLKTKEDIEKDIKEKMKTAEPPPTPAVEEARTGPPPPGPPRGGLMDAIKGGRGRGGGGRGGLLDSIKGRGGRGGGDAGGRGGLLSAIQGRGSGGGDAGGGGRGGLLSAIQGRGSGGGDAGGGGRGGLMAAIQGRGAGRGAGDGGGGRGGLLAAIQARSGGD